MRDNGSRWLKERNRLTLELGISPYNSHTYILRAKCHEQLGCPDLAASDAYRALLLTDEALDEEGEYHEQAVEAIEAWRRETTVISSNDSKKNRVNGSANSSQISDEDDSKTEDSDEEEEPWYYQIAHDHALSSYRILARALSDSGDLKSAYDFTQRGLMAFAGNGDLHTLQNQILGKYRERQSLKDPASDQSNINPREDLPENGCARREIYPWNKHEPERFSEENLSFINGEIKRNAPKCEVIVTELPVLDGDASYIASKPSKVKQLGIFATSNIAPHETVMLEPSILTSSTRLHDSFCDACSSQLPPFSPDAPLPACPLCEDIVFCSQACLERAQSLYHPAICGVMDFDVVGKDPSPFAATNALYTLLVARTMAMAETQDVHPLDLTQIKYLWGDYSHHTLPAERTLPFSFSNNIAQPLHLLARLDKDPFAPTTLARYDTWVINTLLAKFRGTANAKMNEQTGMPEVAGVHWLWSLANHSCAPNVRWEWENGGMGYVARGGEEVVRWGNDKYGVGKEKWEGVIKEGSEVLNHYCDVELPFKERREWAVGALGGICACERCIWEDGKKPK